MSANGERPAGPSGGGTRPHGPTVSGTVRLPAPTRPRDEPSADPAGEFPPPDGPDPAALDPAALRELPLPRLRDLRRRALAEETDLSYLRRLLQGRVDILRAELSRRSSNGTDLAQLIERLPEILADSTPKSRGSARHVTVSVPHSVPHSARYRELDALVMSVELSELDARSDAELLQARTRLIGCEQQVSRRRHVLQRTADACGAEIARRYREGEARVDDLLGGGVPGR